MGKKSNLIHEVKTNLKKECKFGISKYQEKLELKKNGESQHIRGIYSTSTYNTYGKNCTQFINYCLEHHKEVKSLNDCRNYVEEYLRENESRGLSA